MSVRDSLLNYYIINGLTNQSVKIDRVSHDDIGNFYISINDYLMINEVKRQLKNCDSVTIFKSFRM